MKLTGIIMSGSHPVDILELRKTKTRRTYGLEKVNKDPGAWQLVAVFQDGKARFYNPTTEQDITITCPYGGFGDQLWVKETRLEDTHGFHSYWADYLPEEERTRDGVAVNVLGGLKAGLYWKKSSMFMPRKYSRLLLEITSLGAERVQKITEEDAVAEGTVINDFFPVGTAMIAGLSTVDYFAQLWDSLNAKRGYGWEKNPWVWPIGFKLLNGQY